MAKMYGGFAKGDLKTLNAFYYEAFVALITLAAFIFFWAVAQFYFFKDFYMSFGYYLIFNNRIFFELLAILATLAYLFQEGTTRQFRARRAVYIELEKLPDTYSVFQDVTVAGRSSEAEIFRGNTDFVVVGPTGIYPIEVESQ